MPNTYRGRNENISPCASEKIVAVRRIATWWFGIHRLNHCCNTPRNRNSSQTAATNAITVRLKNRLPIPFIDNRSFIICSVISDCCRSLCSMGSNMPLQCQLSLICASQSDSGNRHTNITMAIKAALHLSFLKSSLKKALGFSLKK